jgi:hypothetical protein
MPEAAWRYQPGISQILAATFLERAGRFSSKTNQAARAQKKSNNQVKKKSHGSFDP